ncbi:hypothetical protein SCA6_004733 [Theobroma cacao]
MCSLVPEHCIAGFILEDLAFEVVDSQNSETDAGFNPTPLKALPADATVHAGLIPPGMLQLVKSHANATASTKPPK